MPKMNFSSEIKSNEIRVFYFFYKLQFKKLQRNTFKIIFLLKMQVQKSSSKFDFSLEHQNPTAPPSQNPSSFEEKLGLVFQKLKSTKIKEAFILYNSRNFPFYSNLFLFFF